MNIAAADLFSSNRLYSRVCMQFRKVISSGNAPDSSVHIQARNCGEIGKADPEEWKLLAYREQLCLLI